MFPLPRGAMAARATSAQVTRPHDRFVCSLGETHRSFVKRTHRIGSDPTGSRIQDPFFVPDSRRYVDAGYPS